MSRRQPYASNDTPSNASSDAEDLLIELSPPPEQELEIHLEDTSPSEPKEKTPDLATAQEPPEPAREQPKQQSTDDKAYSLLKAQLDRERQAREAAQRRADQLATDHSSAQELLRQEQERALAAQKQHLESQELAIDNAISYTESLAAQAQREINRGLSEGDYEASTKAYRELAKAESDLARLKEGKQVIEAQKKMPIERQELPAPRQQQAPQTQWERIEAYITQPAHSLRAQQFMRDNYDDLFKDFDSGATRLSKLLGGHYLAKAENIAEGSDAYFTYLSEHMGYTAPAPTSKQTEAPVPPAKPKAPIPPAAPVSRAANGGSNSSSITLSPAQVQFCKESGISPKEYARMLLKAKSGANDPNYSGPRLTSDL